jgi:hypothetical protein
MMLFQFCRRWLSEAKASCAFPVVVGGNHAIGMVGTLTIGANGRGFVAGDGGGGGATTPLGRPRKAMGMVGTLAKIGDTVGARTGEAVPLRFDVGIGTILPVGRAKVTIGQELLRFVGAGAALWHKSVEFTAR